MDALLSDDFPAFGSRCAGTSAVPPALRVSAEENELRLLTEGSEEDFALEGGESLTDNEISLEAAAPEDARPDNPHSKHVWTRGGECGRGRRGPGGQGCTQHIPRAPEQGSRARRAVNIRAPALTRPRSPASRPDPD
jgi:hypothetical protein